MHAPRVELRPGGVGQVVLHSREIDALIDAKVVPDGEGDAGVRRLAARLLELAVEVVPALRTSELVGANVALRPLPIDGFPSVGGIDDVQGYYEAVTHSGITLGAIIGRLLAQELMGDSVDPLLVPYRPTRFSGTGPGATS
jgi:glycine/D-amino acid oxidase-like deaminating enzyme